MNIVSNYYWAIPIAAALGVMVAARPLLGIFFVLLLSPLKTFGDEILLFAKLLGIWTMLVTFARINNQRKAIRWSGMERPVFFMVLGMSLSFFRTSDTRTVFSHILSLVSLYALLLLVINLIETKGQLRKLMTFFLASGIYPIVQAIMQGVQPDLERTYPRASGTFTLPTGLGGFLIPIVVLSLALLFYPRFSRLSRLLIFFVFCGGMVALFMAFSRGSVIGALAGLIIVLNALSRTRIKNKTFTTGVVIASIVATIWYSWPTIKGLVITPLVDLITESTTFRSLAYRQNEISLIIAITRDNYFMGTGIGSNYRHAVNRYRILYNAPLLPAVPHNIFLYFFGMVGIVGAIGFIWFVVSLARRIRSSHPLVMATYPDLPFFVYIGSVGSLIGYIPVVITHNGLFGNEMWLSIGFSLTSIILTENLRLRKKSEQIPIA